MKRSPACVCLGLVLAGCSNGGGDTSTGGAPEAVDLSGSYDLVFGELAPSLSRNQRLRVDLRALGSGYQAFVTPRGAPLARAAATLEVTVRAEVLILSAGGGTDPFVDSVVRFQQSSEDYFQPQQEFWMSLSLERGADGRLDGKAAGEMIFLAVDDDVPSGIQSFPAQIGPDNEPPVVSIAFAADGPPQAALPFDPITLDFAEPVELESATSRLSLVEGSPAKPAPITWTPEPSLTPSLGVMRVAGQPFVGPLPGDAFLELKVAAGIPDAAGNASTPRDFALLVRGLGPAAPVHDFDGGGEALWGAAALLPPGDPLCEQGGCVKLGPFLPDCSERPGLAGRVTIPGATEVTVRYRVLFDEDKSTLPDKALEIQLEGSEKTTAAHVVGPITDLGPGAGVFHWATPWATAGVPLSPSGDTMERWFRIRGANNRCGVMAPTRYPIVVIVDQVGIAG